MAGPDEAAESSGAPPFAESGTPGSADGAIRCVSGPDADSPGKKKRKVALHLAYVGTAYKGCAVLCWQ